MAKKRKRPRTRRRLASSAMLSAPRRRRRSRSLMTAPRRRKRSRGMSEGIIQAKGETGKYINAMGDGAIGGAAAHATGSVIPDSLFTGNPSIAPYEKWIKRGIKAAVGLIAVKMKQPLVAAGIAGAIAEEIMTTEGILNEGPAGTFSSGRRLQATRYARPGILRDSALLSDSRLLSEGANYMQSYQGQALYESPKDEFNY